MEHSRNKQNNSKKKPDLLQNPQLMTAQITLGRTTGIKVSNQNPSINPIEVMQQAQQLWQQNDNLESINLMKGLMQYIKSTKYNDQPFLCIVHTNLAVSYYKIGFLQEAYEEFATTLSLIKQLGLNLKSQMNKGSTNISKMSQKLKYDMLGTKIQLQTCILYSEMGKHEIALDHAKISCKQAYNMIFDMQLIQYQHLITILNKNKSAYAPNHENQIACQGYQNLINNIIVLDQLINCSKDLKQQFISKQKSQLLEQQKQSLSKTGKLSGRINLQLMFSLTPQNVDTLWVYKNKILDEIQMKFVKPEVFQTKNFWQNNQVIQKIVYLILSLYCYSTQTRFLQKNKDKGCDPSEVLDSQHWLSRSLQIAYIFLPHQTPILNQIITVHDRFHGIDKQTIPQDKQIGGFFKVLRPLTKPRSNYSNKNILCSPIMIRIQVPKIEIQMRQNQSQTNNNQHSSKMAVKNIDFANKTIDLDNLTKNNKIRGLTGVKKYDLTEISQSTIKHKPNTKIDFTQNLKNIYASRKIKSVAQNNKIQRMKINLTGLISHQEIQGVKSMRRPHSYDKQIDKPQQSHPLHTERKKKSSSLSKKEGDRRKRSITSNSTGLKLDGINMLPNPFKKGDDQDHFEFSGLSDRLSNVETTKIGGNIFINNNINLFISKQSLEQSKKGKQDKTMYQVSRRQTFISKRKAHNSNMTGIRNPDFAI